MSSTPAGHLTEDETGDNGHGHRHLGLALIVISVAQLMVVLDSTIVNIALPHIKTDLHFSDVGLSWVVNAYTLAFGGLLLLGGRAGDLLGRRKVFVAGVAVFTVASLIGGLVTNPTGMIFARVLQGVGAAIASPTALSLITTTFPAGAARNRAMGIYAAMSGAGAAIGLILGGALTEWSWRWTFFINVPIGLAVVLLAPRVLGESMPQRGAFDLPGAVTATGGLVSLVYGLNHAASDGWADPVTVTTVAAGLVLLVLFLVIEARSRHALMPMRILADRSRAVTYVAMLATGAALFAMFYFLSLYVQGPMGLGPLEAGFAFLPFSVGIVAAAQLASYLITRTDPRWIAGAGGLLSAAGMLWLSRLEVDSGYVTGLLPPMLVLSVGLGLTFVPLTLTAVYGVDRHDAGVASAVLNTTQQVGGALGLAALSTVASSAATHRAQELARGLKEQVATGQLLPEQLQTAANRAILEAQTAGFTRAFVLGAVIMVVSALIVIAFLTIRHEELDSDAPVHLG
ncbi:MAG: drug resistance transporter, EmrB/QacA subfamily [Cryptosporangiaceae bacterium]|jgi:EmrB/QacA subfamily drug resistance transporter|nr:drug resistance transporter, EmrB/QacA subfamily [Cryptosporangiaceae bacterium]